tara:strand:+ start:1163 stop:2170 length:1008 start_codon:yes stop_codon:yes gene_type:complete
LQLTLSEIADFVNGTVIGDGGIVISGVSEIQNGISGTITFLSNPIYKKYLSSTAADAIFVDDKKILNGKNGILVSNPQLAIAKILESFSPRKKKSPMIDSKAIISKTAIIGKEVIIHPGSIIGEYVSIGDRTEIGNNTVIGDNTILGSDCVLFSNISIYDNIKIGNSVIIHSGTSIGSDGFGFVFDKDRYVKIPQIGNVIIGDNVEIGSNCAIDRATIGNTIIGDMTKIDNLVHIAHNVKIGTGCLLTAGFAIAGSSEIGDNCVFAGQVGVAPHLKIGSNSIFASRSGITKSLEGGKTYAGFPAREIRDYNRRQALINSIDKIRNDLNQLTEDGA